MMALLLLTWSVQAADDFEVIDEGDGEYREKPDLSGYKKSEFDKTYLAYMEDEEEFKWSDQMLLDSQIVRITDELYDTQIYEREGSKAPWLIIFTKDRFNHGADPGWNQLNLLLFSSMWEVKQAKLDSLNIGFVDIYESELIKETFDLTVVPSVRYIDYNRVYHMNWNDKSYPYYSTADFMLFLSEGYGNAPVETLRPRVSEGLHIFFEYCCSWLSMDSNFETIMTTFLKARKLMKEQLSIEIDMKKDNPNFGKKNSFKKSQIRSVIMKVWLPLLALTVVGTTLLCAVPVLICVSRKQNQIPANELKQKSQEKKKKA